ncbi:aldolase/citrate lyase family protein [Streptomyces thinghirensis]|nr:aldolase/citrate lyase family protein [Streptomyces thinghirensis]
MTAAAAQGRRRSRTGRHRRTGTGPALSRPRRGGHHPPSRRQRRRRPAGRRRDHYPPLGERGFATYSRAGRFGTVTAQEHLSAGEDTLVVAMIETERACAAAGEIAATKGVDAVLVGPSDLAADCGFPGQDVIDGLTRSAHRAARGAGRAVMTIVPSATAAARGRGGGRTADPVQHGCRPHGRLPLTRATEPG